MAGVTLDAGALVAAQRNDRRFWAFWKWLTLRGVVANVPSPVVAQAWRGGRDARMAMVLSGCHELAMDPGSSRRTGELCGAAGAADVVDAFVVLGAADRRDEILTSDADDLRALAPHAPGLGRIRTLEELGS